MGWGLSDERVSDIGKTGASMSFHNVGFGALDADLNAARSNLFGQFAALAGVNSDGADEPTPISAANPLTGGGTSFDDDKGEGEGEGEDDD